MVEGEAVSFVTVTPTVGIAVIGKRIGFLVFTVGEAVGADRTPLGLDVIAEPIVSSSVVVVTPSAEDPRYGSVSFAPPPSTSTVGDEVSRVVVGSWLVVGTGTAASVAVGAVDGEEFGRRLRVGL